MEDYIIRPVFEEDVQALLDIYAYYVEKTAATFEYEPPTVDEFIGRIKSAQRRYPYLCISYDDEIVGFAFAHAFRERPAYDYSAEVTIYLHHDHRHEGYGKAIYTALETELKRMGVMDLYACVAVPKGDDEHLSMDSPRFHEAMGYQICGTFANCGYKFGRWYDMVWMVKHISDHADDPKPIIPYPDLQPVGRGGEKLSYYDDKLVRLHTKWGEVFYGVADHFSAEYGMHEFGNEEEGLQIDNFIFYDGEIAGIEVLSL